MIEKIYICTMMKKITQYVLCVACSISFLTCLSACSDPAEVAEVERLSIRNEALIRTVDSLQAELDLLKAQSDSVKSTLKSLDMHH